MNKTVNKPQTIDQVLMLLDSLRALVNQSGFDQLRHATQTATRAECAGADDEVVISALCHDIGKAISIPNHAAISAEILRPYVRPDCYFAVRAHRDFQRDGTEARAEFTEQPWFTLATTLSDEWDHLSSDPHYDTFPLAHFESRLREVFRTPRYGPVPGMPW